MQKQEGPQVGHDHGALSGRRWTWEPSGKSEGRCVAWILGRIIHLMGFQEVEEPGEVACPAAQGTRRAVEVIPAEGRIFSREVWRGAERFTFCVVRHRR